MWLSKFKNVFKESFKVRFEKREMVNLRSEEYEAESDVSMGTDSSFGMKSFMHRFLEK